ncbi:DivIVA domain-containing protein [Stackebrandtia nassauensis]|uniref:Cell wall synthesis protein Wag31 n=1 Tax=Stackebrandtia nassauensis (strain DSM 44728 / CIP 108903 / NRRL B-16338 / NBRC 102104 / LLR-40K-21) TaxID=446470 RepID=D3PZW9_STANL|nr:DivIVA domain-containing protein [Stackebrandtia nassauensis]ADD43656.1 DivIVA family protein [Stackebrandtia nassauensis DSM 44728]
MPLTPADVHSISFKKAPIGNRGYDEDEVDNFLDEVERELERLIEANNQLRKQNEQLAAGAPAGSVDNAELLAEFERLQHEKVQAEKAAAALESELDELRRSGALSNGPGAQGPEGGEQQALRLLMVAQRTADDHLESARSEADTVLTEARTEADSVLTKARSQAESLEEEAQRRHKEIMNNLESKRAALHKHIEELKTFERQYRTRLKAYLESQLRDLTGRGEGVIEGDSSDQGELRSSGPSPALTAAGNDAVR